MRKLILIVHTSLDGYVAGLNGDLSGFEAAEENLEFVVQLTKEADAAMFGRVSFELLDKYWPQAKNHPKATQGEIEYSNWYNQAHKIIASKTLKSKDVENATILNGNLIAQIHEIKNQPGKSILLFGSPGIFQSLVEFDIIDEYWVFINPVVFGQGLPLFIPMNTKIKLQLRQSIPFANGEIAHHFVVKNSQAIND